MHRPEDVALRDVSAPQRTIRGADRPASVAFAAVKVLDPARKKSTAFTLFHAEPGTVASVRSRLPFP